MRQMPPRVCGVQASAETVNPSNGSLERYECLSPERLRLLIGDVTKAEQASAETRDATARLQVTFSPMK
jgi:hypothetical protein